MDAECSALQQLGCIFDTVSQWPCRSLASAVVNPEVALEMCSVYHVVPSFPAVSNTFWCFFLDSAFTALYLAETTQDLGK